jgi:hypothetical protein
MIGRIQFTDPGARANEPVLAIRSKESPAINEMESLMEV